MRNSKQNIKQLCLEYMSDNIYLEVAFDYTFDVPNNLARPNNRFLPCLGFEYTKVNENCMRDVSFGLD